MTRTKEIRASLHRLPWFQGALFLLISACAGCLGQPKSEIRRPAPLDAAEAVKEGAKIVAGLLGQKPATNAISAGLLTIRPRGGNPAENPVKFSVVVGAANWSSIYETGGASNHQGSRLTVVHEDGGPNRYTLEEPALTGDAPRQLAGNQTMIPFAGSDFWVADFGLEFFHWPAQRLIKKEIRRSRSCAVLESVNPQPAEGAYSRVVCWIDAENGGIVRAEAYDFEGSLLKVFEPKEFKKINGQWLLEGMQIQNRQTGSKTHIEIELKNP